MRAVRYDRFEGIDGLTVDERPDPTPAPDEVVVRVEASGINPGSLSALHGAPYVPGRDLAGEVVALGGDVHGLGLGDAVLGRVQDWWAHAQLVAVPASQLVAKPAALSWDAAGSLHTAAMAGVAGVRAVRPGPGDLVVVSGASGGVGLTAAQLARRAGADVIGLAADDRHAWLRDHGVTPVAYGDGARERIEAVAGGREVDAFLDTAGSGSVALALDLGVAEDRINTVVDFAAARSSRIHTRGTADAGGTSTLTELADLVAEGVLAFPIAAAFGLDEVRDAYRALAGRPPLGRVVLRPWWVTDPGRATPPGG